MRVLNTQTMQNLSHHAAVRKDSTTNGAKPHPQKFLIELLLRRFTLQTSSSNTIHPLHGLSFVC